MHITAISLLRIYAHAVVLYILLPSFEKEKRTNQGEDAYYTQRCTNANARLGAGG